MFAEEMRRAINAAPKGKLCALSQALWKGFAAGAVGEDDAQSMAELIAARNTLPPAVVARRQVGSRPRYPENMQRRRWQAMRGMMPPQIAAHFTMGQIAALSVICQEILERNGECRLTIGVIAMRAGVGRTTVQNALRAARALGFMSVEEWRISFWRNAPNTVKVTSIEWRQWLRFRGSKRVGSVSRAGAGTKHRKARPAGGKSQRGKERGSPRHPTESHPGLGEARRH